MALPVALALGALASTFCSAAAQATPTPVPWPTQHEHLEIQYSPAFGTVHRKPVYYDFDHLSYRADLFQIDGAPSLFVPANFSSLWLNTTLYMITNAPFQSCVKLEMGFGMMRPDWFLTPNATVLGQVYMTHRYNASGTEPNNANASTFYYEPCTWTRKPVPGQMPPYFDYFSNAAGGGFQMQAPSPLGIVINEYNNFEPHPFPAGDSTFVVPPNIFCIPTTELLGAHRAPVTAEEALDRLHAAVSLATGVKGVQLPVYDMLMAAYSSAMDA